MESTVYEFNFGSIEMEAGETYWEIAYGSALPSTAVIDSIEISFTVGISSWASDSTISMKRASIDVEKGYPGCGKYYENGQTWQDATSSRVTFESNMDFSQSDISVFDGELIVYMELDYDSSAKGVFGKAGTITVYYTESSLERPAAPTVTQNNDGTFTARWDEVTGTGGSESDVVTYSLWNGNDGIQLSSYSESRTYTGDIPVYGTALIYYVYAKYCGIYEKGDGKTITFVAPTLSAPTNVKLSAATGETTTISWSASSLSKTTGTITYSIRKNGKEVATATSTSYPFKKDETSTWGTNAVTLTVVAKATTINQDYPSLESNASSGVTFTYKSADKTVAYCDGSTYIPCLVHYCNGTDWIKCVPYYCDGTSWIPISYT